MDVSVCRKLALSPVSPAQPRPSLPLLDVSPHFPLLVLLRVPQTPHPEILPGSQQGTPRPQLAGVPCAWSFCCRVYMALTVPGSEMESWVPMCLGFGGLWEVMGSEVVMQGLQGGTGGFRRTGGET